MNGPSARFSQLTQAFPGWFDEEREALKTLLQELRDEVRAPRGDPNPALGARFEALEERIDLLAERARRDFLSPLGACADELEHAPGDGRIACVLEAFVEAERPDLGDICESMLDRILAATGARRGFVLLCFPESTEVEVVAARHFQTRNLLLEEYRFSRTLIRRVLKRGATVLLRNASVDPKFSSLASVRALQIRSVLVAPMKCGARTLGAVYIDDDTRAGAFDEEDRRLLETAARFAVFYLRHARLLPARLDGQSRVFLDASKASRTLVGRDRRILEVLDTIRRVADSPATVLIEGESGTGKELVARALHFDSRRREAPFVAVNCAAIPEALLESELFGHEKGAFTGAGARRLGQIEEASGGTLFLDEVSELAYPLQAKLLRFLQSGEVHRLGGGGLVQVDVRVVAATSRNLLKWVGDGKFQDALYYRLNVIPLRIPPLRERKGDIPLLVDHFLARFNAIYGTARSIEPEVYRWLEAYPFPGNVRELENLVHQTVLLAPEDRVRIGDLPRDILRHNFPRVTLESKPAVGLVGSTPSDPVDFRRRREEIERRLAEQERGLVERVLRETAGNITAAARKLGIHRVTLHRMLRRRTRPGL